AATATKRAIEARHEFANERSLLSSGLRFSGIDVLPTTMLLLLLRMREKEYSRGKIWTATSTFSYFETQGGARQFLDCLMLCADGVPPANACFFSAVSRGLRS